MRISELSPDLRPKSPPPPPPAEPLPRLLDDLESAIADAELLSPADFPHASAKLAAHLRRSLSRLAALPPLPDSGKLQIWKLAYRLWNACVDLSNAAPRPYEDHAALRQVAADLLGLAGSPAGIPSPAIKAAAFYHRTGKIWHELRRFDLAAACFEKATELAPRPDVDAVHSAEERRLLLDLNVARSRTAWESGEKSLALGLLNRSKSLLFRSADHCKALAEQYLQFAKSILAGSEKSDGVNEASKLINEALDLCEKGLGLAQNQEQKSSSKVLREKLLRFLAATHLQGEEFESVLKCVKVLRESGGEHPSVGFMAMRAWLGLRRPAEAEKELREMVASRSVPDGICVSAVEAFFQEAGAVVADAAKEVFLGLIGRGQVSAGAAVRVVHRMVAGWEGGEGGRIRARAALELVSDERVGDLFAGDGEGITKERGTMHAVIWNW